MDVDRDRQIAVPLWMLAGSSDSREKNLDAGGGARLRRGVVGVAGSEQTSLKACCRIVFWFFCFFQTSVGSRTFHNLKRMKTSNPVADKS